MRRRVRKFRPGASIVTAVVGLALAAGLASTPTSSATQLSAAAEEDPRPNVILITTDDQALSDLAWMPKTRTSLGKAGLTFTDGISPHPLCCPARAEILTGQYAQNNGVYTNQGVFGGYGALADPDNTLPAWLQDAGYRTGFIGKFLNGYKHTVHGRPAGWTWWDPTIIGTYDYLDYTQANNGNPIQSDGTYITDYVAAVTRTRIEEWSQQRAPFFLWASYVAPHKTCVSEIDGVRCNGFPKPEAAYASAYGGATNPARLKGSYNEADVSDKPRVIRRQAKKDSGRLSDFFRARIRSLASVDDAVANTVAALAETGELQNTYILFTSDNGWLLGEHRFVGKKLAFEESLRVPFLMRGPGIPAGLTRSQTVSVLDIAPTVLSATGVSPGRIMDGVSVLPYVGGRQTRLIQSGRITNDPTKSRFNYRGVRERRYTYTRWASGFEELYDRVRDPHQLVNVANDPRYRKVRKELRSRLRKLRDCAGATWCYRSFGEVPALVDS